VSAARARLVPVALLALIATAFTARPAGAQQEPTPRLDGARVAGEVLGGAYAGIGGFFLGRYVGTGVADLVGVEHEVTRRRIGVATGFVGGGLATAGVVYAIGSMGDQAGDFNATALGTGVGFAAALAIGQMVFEPGGPPAGRRSTAMRWATINMLALLPAIGGTIGFNSTRRTQ